MSLAQAAVRMAEQGWHVLQLNGKKPLRPGQGFYDANSDPDVVAKWWSEHSNANVGVWPGASGLLVIDIDGPDGRDTAESLGLLEIDTRMSETGRDDGGLHLYFQHPGGEIGNVQLGPGVEVRADKGYVVVPPSRHPDTGTEYSWVNQAEPAQLPDPVRSLILADGNKVWSPERSDEDDQDVWREGERNNRLTSHAGKLRHVGMSAAEILPALLELNQRRCTPPLPETEVKGIARGIERYDPPPAPEKIVSSLGISDLSPDAPEGLSDALKALRDWRRTATAQQEAAAGTLVRNAFKQAGFDRPAELWDSAAPREDEGSEFELEEAGEPETFDPETEAAAGDLLQGSDILEEMIQATDRLGHIGETVNRKVVYLAAIAGHTARTHEDAIHLVVKGDSASGKNELLRRVLKLLPETRVRFLTGVSEQGLVYHGGDLEGVLVFQEAEGEDDSEYQVRQAMSEGWLTRLTVRDGESYEVKTYVRGSVFTTTTKISLHSENQTRVFDLHTDDSADLTREVILSVARRAEGEVLDQDEAGELLNLWRAAATMLEPAGVVIPYASVIAERFPARRVRVRRDIKRVLSLLRASALLHQKSRARDDRNCIVCTPDDYRMVYPLVQRVLGPTMSGLTEKARKIAELQAELSDKLHGPEWLDRTDLQREAYKQGVASEKTVRKWCDHFVDLGVWETRLEAGKRQHRIIRDVGEEPLNLHTPDELHELLNEAEDGSDEPDTEEEAES